MAYLIDKTYFNGSINVPNSNEYDAAFDNELNLSIDRYARQFLQWSLGYSLFNELDSNITDGELDAGAPQKWEDLVNGVEYVKDGKTYFWKGLIYTEGLSKKSILAHYTYFNQYQESINSGVGQVVTAAKNAINVNPTQHLVTIYNEFVIMYQGENAYWNCTPTYLSDWGIWEYCQTANNSNYVSLRQFLTDKAENYPDAAIPILGYKNSLGL